MQIYMVGGRILDRLRIQLRDRATDHTCDLEIDIWDNSLSHKWLAALNTLLRENYLLEKNFCFLGWSDGPRSGEFICEQINRSIAEINKDDIGYAIQDHFCLSDMLISGDVGIGKPGAKINRERTNDLHRYFEDLQGTSGHCSPYYHRSQPNTKYHIRQLNLLCHEFECWALSRRESLYAPEWQRPNQLMCWLQAPRFMLEDIDHDLFGIETLNRPMGGVYVGVNKAVGKHHWEVFVDEGKDARIDALTTKVLQSQTEAAGDFDIEWGNNPGMFAWQAQRLQDFRDWLINNGLDPQDPALTIGHPQIGQVDLQRTFGTTDYQKVWNIMQKHLDVRSVCTSDASATYDYHWSDPDFVSRQIKIIEGA